jgi:hypothetical protein
LIPAIRLATPEEIENIKDGANLNNASTVVAFPGATTEFAVIKTVTEVDPVIFEEKTPKQKKMMFLFGIETALRMMGVPEYYFNILEEDAEWRTTAEKWGAETISKGPERRFKKVL